MAKNSDADKKWNRPWSMEEIIETADNWSLAGDVALLNSIKAYADNLLTKTLSISNNVDDLLNSLNEVGLKLEISHNEFQSLRNTQFIESRVYEDDETLDVQEVAKEEEKILTEEEKERMIREATAEGLRVMDKYFDKIEVSISDSEEESETSYVLQPKDLYMDRPLPLVIGTEDWYKKWHVGLADTSSEDESDKVSETFSESDSDDHLPKDLLRGSETSSELDFSSQTSENRPVANSTFNESTKQHDIFDSDDESDGQGSLPVKAPISNANFAKQLAEKLGNVMNEREDISGVEVNKRPIQPAQSDRFMGNLFSDEPPPLLDDLDDTILPNSAQTGLFSGGQGLFDDNEDELFWGQQSRLPKVGTEEKKVQSRREVPPDVYKNAQMPLPKSSQVSSKGLFDSDESSEEEEEDLFASKKKTEISKPPFLQPYKTAAPLFDEEPPALVTEKQKVEEPVKKKPTGLSSSLFLDEGKTAGITGEKGIKSKKISLFDDDEDIKVEAVGGKAATKKINLFDDDDDLFKDDLFSGFTSKKSTLSLFDSPESVDTEVKIAQNKPKVPGLFSDAEEEEEEERQSNVSKTIDDRNRGMVTKNGASIEADSEEIIEASNNKLEEGITRENSKEIGEKSADDERQVIGAEKRVVTGGLFDDDDDEEDDLFKGDNAVAAAATPSPPKGSLWEPPQLEVTVTTTPDTTSKAPRKAEGISLFGSSPPPPDDDDWDVKSDNFSDTEDQFSFRIDANAGVSSLFDNEPPSLGPNDSSGIVRDQNVTRVDTDDSSFYPYASSSRRLSSDIFNEQQSQDSLFVTKSKTESMLVAPPPLDIIPEDAKAGSHIDITPSGDPSDLEQNSTSENLTSDSLFEKNSPKPIVVSLFDDDDDDNYDYDDLFSPPVRKEPSLFENPNNDIASESVDKKNPDAKDETSKEPEPQSPAGKSKIANLIDQIRSDSAKEPPLPSAAGSPRKLKHNLNINVNALLPGYAPPKIRELSKSHSLDFPKERKEDATEDFSTPPDAALFSPQTAARRPPLKTQNAADSGRTASFDDALDGVEVLHSITKDRAKIPIKRRPSTRRGRREAITRSAVDLTADNSEIITVSGQEEVERETEKKQPIAVEVGVGDTHQPSSEIKAAGDDIFKGDGDGSEEPFPSLSGRKASSDKPKSAIFDSDDSDGDLFGLAGTKKDEKQSKEVKNKLENVASNTKKSLFNDSSSDDDLFSGSSKGGGAAAASRKRNLVQSKPAGKKTQKVSTSLRKLENIETDDDPLSSLLK